MKHGKAPKKDFSFSSLPSNRFFQYWDILRHQGLSVFSLCLFCLVGFLPYALTRYYFVALTSKELSRGSALGSSAVQSLYLYYFLLRLPCLLFASLFVAGTLRLFKRMSYGEGYLFMADFFEGVKENVGGCLGHFALYWLSSSLLLYGTEAGIALGAWHQYLFLALLFFIVLPLLLVSLYLSAVYADGFFAKFIASIKVFLRHYPSILLASLILEVPLGLLALGLSPIQLFVPIGYALLWLPLAYLAVVLLLNRCFDKDINEQNFPDLVDKGLSRQKEGEEK